jgi:hypothetical protein
MAEEDIGVCAECGGPDHYPWDMPACYCSQDKPVKLGKMPAGCRGCNYKWNCDTRRSIYDYLKEGGVIGELG